MTKSSNKAFPNKTSENKRPRKNVELGELRQLLFGHEKAQIDQLRERLDNSKLLAKDVMRVLPESIRLRSSRDKEVAKALEPSIEEGIRASIKKNPRALADTLYPIMGPSIRKAISSAILSMIQSINHVIEHTFSLQGLKWRIEALTTKKPFAEVVLLNTLIYQVEQVFLIHRNTGLVLQHVVSKGVTTQDPDQVSSMLKAIQDFVHDSFGVENGECLDALRMEGDHSIWIEQGPQAILAVIIRGTPPLDLRLLLRETLDDIHLAQSHALQSFEGDPTPFKFIKSQLEHCLQFQFKQKKHRISPLLWISLAAMFFLVGIWSVSFYQNHQRWAYFLEKLNGKSGFVVVDTEKRSGKYHVFGLRDPLASDPAKIIEQANLEPDKVVFHWKNYQSLDPEFMLKRIKNLLNPPETVALQLKDGVIHARGVASHHWIEEKRSILKHMNGTIYFHDDGLIDTDLRDFEIIKKNIEKQAVFFHTLEKEIATGQEVKIKNLSESISKLFKLGNVLNRDVIIKIVGHTDSSGPDELNTAISLARAKSMASILTSKGFKTDKFITVGVGSDEPVRKEITEQDKKLNRRITFKVILTKNQI